MKILVDECIPRKLKNSFPEHECRAVNELGCVNYLNGIILAPEK